MEKCKTCANGYPSVSCANCGSGYKNYIDSRNESMEVGSLTKEQYRTLWMDLVEKCNAQQQEIERLNKVLDDWKYNAKCDADHIAGLIADKDEQAGRIMQYDAVLKQARKALKTCEEIASSEKNQLFWTADVAQKSIKAIDALLGGKEDE